MQAWMRQRPSPSRRRSPLPSPAAGQDPPTGGLPQEADAGDRGGDPRGAVPSGTEPASGSPGQDAPGALTEHILLAGASSPALTAPAPTSASPAAPSPWEQPPSRQSPDFCASDSPTPTEVVDDEGVRVASEAMAEQEAEARAALAAEGLEEAARAPVPEEAGSGMASGSSAGSMGWLGGPDPDSGQDERPAPDVPGQASPRPGDARGAVQGGQAGAEGESLGVCLRETGAG